MGKVTIKGGFIGSSKVGISVNDPSCDLSVDGMSFSNNAQDVVVSAANSIDLKSNKFGVKIPDMPASVSTLSPEVSLVEDAARPARRKKYFAGFSFSKGDHLK